MVQGWPGLSQQAGCDQETGHTKKGRDDTAEGRHGQVSRVCQGERVLEGAGSAQVQAGHQGESRE